MSDYGITPQGFNRKRLDQLLEELNEEVRSIFGENFNLSPESPDGQINGVISESNANLWEIAQYSYDSFNPSAATGNALSNLVQLNGIRRLAAAPSRVLLKLSGSPYVNIPAGSLVGSSETEVVFSTEISESLGSEGVAHVYASATVSGPVFAATGSLTRIETPISGWDSVINELPAQIGRNEETDSELRSRRERSVSSGAQAVIDAIYSSVANLEGVTQVKVLENDTDQTDENGLPPHSFHVIVSGGAESDIAQTIWLKKPAGIQSFGNMSEEIIDSQGYSHDIGFSRPVDVDVYVSIQIRPFGGFPSDGEARIKQAIIEYSRGEMIPSQGFFLSEDVIFSRMYTPVNSVPGHEVIELLIGSDPLSMGISNISIAMEESSRFSEDSITVIILS